MINSNAQALPSEAKVSMVRTKAPFFNAALIKHIFSNRKMVSYFLYFREVMYSSSLEMSDHDREIIADAITDNFSNYHKPAMDWTAHTCISFISETPFPKGHDLSSFGTSSKITLENGKERNIISVFIVDNDERFSSVQQYVPPKEECFILREGAINDLPENELLYI